MNSRSGKEILINMISYGCAMKYVIVFIVMMLSLSVVFAENECPLGMINDTAPGQCVLYADSDSNEICDLSEPHNCTTETTTNNPAGIELSGTQLKAMTVEQVANAYGIGKELFAQELGKMINIKISPKDSLQLLHDNNALGMATVKEVAAKLASGSIIKNDDTITKPASRTTYYLIPIVIISTVLYFFTFILSKNNIMTTMTHRKIWNWLLTVFFIATTFFAIIWLLNAEFALGIRLPINTSYWHIVTGLVMIMISIFHIGWHMSYYFGKKKK